VPGEKPHGEQDAERDEPSDCESVPQEPPSRECPVSQRLDGETFILNRLSCLGGVDTHKPEA